MLDFAESFFREEERAGFVVSRTMKHAWAAQLEVLAEILKVLEKYNLQYYAFHGTLLGCVRHGGFVPWDDDVDIAMKRADYDRFLKIAQAALPEGFCVLNVHMVKEYTMSFTRVTNSHSIDISEARLQRYHGCPFVVGIDIFPLDYLPEDPEVVESQKEMLHMIEYMLSLTESTLDFQALNHVEAVADYEEVLEEGLRTLEDMTHIAIDRTESVGWQLRKVYDRVCAMYSERDGHILTSMPEHSRDKGFYFQEDWFAKIQYQQFEVMELAVPWEYEQVLTARYGDWRTPVRGTAEHDYPFYKEMLEELWNRGLWLDVKP